MGFLTIFNLIDGFFTKVFKYLVEHPVTLAIIVAFALGFFVARHFTETKSHKQLVALQAEIVKQKAKIDEVERQSIVDATLNKEREDKLREEIANVVDDYELKLTSQPEKVKIVKVLVPGQTKPTDVYVEGNEVACRRLPSAYADEVNKLVLAGERSVK